MTKSYEDIKQLFGPGPYKLHLGCGSVFLDGFINIDIKMPSDGHVDLIADARSLPFHDRTCSEIRAYHLIEHIKRPDILKTLVHWFALLANGGKLRLELPDFDRVVYNYMLGNDSFLDHIFGNQENEGQFHYWGYNFLRLKRDLVSVGFKNVEEERVTDYHVDDEPCFGISAIKRARTEFHLEPTNVCTRKDNRCSYCADKNVRKEGFLDLGFARSIIEQIASLNSDSKEILLFLSGEPLLHPKIGELIRVANQAGTTVIHTNADVLTREKAIEIINSGLGKIYLNLHPDSKTGKISSRVLKNIHEFLKINDHQIKTFIQRIIPFPESIPSEEEIKKNFPGVDEVRFRRPHNWSHRNSIKGAEEMVLEDPFVLPHYRNRSYTCRFLRDNMAIAWDGRVPVCCADLNGEWIIGDLTKQTIREVDLILDGIEDRQLQQETDVGLCSGCERYRI